MARQNQSVRDATVTDANPYASGGEGMDYPPRPRLRFYQTFMLSSTAGLGCFLIAAPISRSSKAAAALSTLACFSLLVAGIIYGIWAGRKAAALKANRLAGQNSIVAGIGIVAATCFVIGILTRDYWAKSVQILIAGCGLMALNSLLWAYITQRSSVSVERDSTGREGPAGQT